MNKKLPLWFFLLFTWVFFIALMLFGAEVLKFQVYKRQKSFYSRAIIAIASFPHLVKESFDQISKPSLLIVPGKYKAGPNFTVNGKFVDSNYVLLSTFDPKKNRSTVKLLSLADQKVIYHWTPSFDTIEKILGTKSKFWHDLNKNNIRIFHPLLFADGSMIFHADMSPLIKIDKDSKVVWILNGFFHHSQELDAEGNIWVPSLIEHSKFYPKLFPRLNDNAITEISRDGKILFQKSAAEILDENGYRGLLIGGPYENDLLHLNDLQPALTTTKYWNKGDLLVSIRNKSTVFLYRPSTNKIIWLKTGPWLNQHDVDFIDQSSIGVFGNDIVRYDAQVITESNSFEVFVHGNNQQYIYDFKTNQTDTPYSEFFKKAKIATSTEGRSDVLSNGDLFVEETNNNRLLRGNKKDIVWQYVDRIDDKSVAALCWSRYLTKEEFKNLKFIPAAFSK